MLVPGHGRAARLTRCDRHGPGLFFKDARQRRQLRGRRDAPVHDRRTVSRRLLVDFNRDRAGNGPLITGERHGERPVLVRIGCRSGTANSATASPPMRISSFGSWPRLKRPRCRDDQPLVARADRQLAEQDSGLVFSLNRGLKRAGRRPASSRDQR